MSVFTRIYEVVKLIPCGHVASYGQVAALAGNPRWSRVVGYALHVNPEPNSIPCFRVVTKDGRPSRAFAFGGENRQIELLRNEGGRLYRNRGRAMRGYVPLCLEAGRGRASENRTGCQERIISSIRLKPGRMLGSQRIFSSGAVLTVSAH